MMGQAGYTILAVGFANWLGCDPRALAAQLRQRGHFLIEVDAQDYVPWRWQRRDLKILRRLFLSSMIAEYNLEILQRSLQSHYDFVLVFKGMFIRPATLQALRSRGRPVYSFYPDVSFEDHGADIPSGLGSFDCVFTTKSFHGSSHLQRFGIRALQHVRHGFDPEVHRPIRLTAKQASTYGCDVSFVGCWAPEKEDALLRIAKTRPNLRLHVYGIGWNRASRNFKEAIGQNLRPGVFGDELALVYCASKVNLGLLSRSPSDPSSKDLTTVRTFQIPACAAFLLHEDTSEVRKYFDAEKEIVLFDSGQELISKLDRFVADDKARLEIAERGYQRSTSSRYDYSAAAKVICEYHARVQEIQ